MNDTIVVSFLGAMAIVLAAWWPAYLSYKTTKKSNADITKIKDQILPGNGTKIHEYLAEARDQLIELKAEVKEVSFDLKRHQYTYHHDRRIEE